MFLYYSCLLMDIPPRSNGCKITKKSATLQIFSPYFCEKVRFSPKTCSYV